MKQIEDNSGGISLVGGWLFIQCTLLALHYGFNKILPLWVLWFPSIVLIVSLIVTLIIILIIFIIMWMVK